MAGVREVILTGTEASLQQGPQENVVTIRSLQELTMQVAMFVRKLFPDRPRDEYMIITERIVRSIRDGVVEVTIHADERGVSMKNEANA